MSNVKSLMKCVAVFAMMGTCHYAGAVGKSIDDINIKVKASEIVVADLNGKGANELKRILPQKIAGIKADQIIAMGKDEEKQAVIETLQKGFLDKSKELNVEKMKTAGCLVAFNLATKKAVEVVLGGLGSDDDFAKLFETNLHELAVVRAIDEMYAGSSLKADSVLADYKNLIETAKYKYDGKSDIVLKDAKEFEIAVDKIAEFNSKVGKFTNELLVTAIARVKKSVGDVKQAEIDALNTQVDKLKKDLDEADKKKGPGKAMTVQEIRDAYDTINLYDEDSVIMHVSQWYYNQKELEDENTALKAKLGNQQPQGQPAAKITEDSGLDTVVPVAQAAVENLQQVTKNKKLLELGLGKSFENFSNSLDKIGKELKKIEEAQKPEEGKKDKNVDSDHNPNLDNSGGITRQLGVDFGMVNGKYVETNGSKEELENFFEFKNSKVTLKNNAMYTNLYDTPSYVPFHNDYIKFCKLNNVKPAF